MSKCIFMAMPVITTYQEPATGMTECQNSRRKLCEIDHLVSKSGRGFERGMKPPSTTSNVPLERLTAHRTFASRTRQGRTKQDMLGQIPDTLFGQFRSNHNTPIAEWTSQWRPHRICRRSNPRFAIWSQQ